MLVETAGMQMRQPPITNNTVRRPSRLPCHPETGPTDDQLETLVDLRPNSKSRRGRSKTRKCTVGHVSASENITRIVFVGPFSDGIFRLSIDERPNAKGVPQDGAITNGGKRRESLAPNPQLPFLGNNRPTGSNGST
ncbi:hypothetical protein NYO67_4596 [Aspergillus flavus]|nr:hypothetical protein NYO67_4596 [Aspergillus flavus]